MLSILMFCMALGHHSSAAPHTQYKTGRRLRTSPLYTRLKQADAVFEQIMGFERPVWYDISSESKLILLFREAISA